MIFPLALISGTALAIAGNRIITQKASTVAKRIAPPANSQPLLVGGIYLDGNIEPKTRDGVIWLLNSGTSEQLDQAALSLIQTGYPLAARECAKRSHVLKSRKALLEAKRAEAAREAARMNAIKSLEEKSKATNGAVSENANGMARASVSESGEQAREATHGDSPAS